MMNPPRPRPTRMQSAAAATRKVLVDYKDVLLFVAGGLFVKLLGLA